MRRSILIGFFGVGVACLVASIPWARPAHGDENGVTRYAVQVSVEPQKGDYLVTCAVSDLATGQALFEPQVLVRPGVPAQARSGSASDPGARRFALTVSVDSGVVDYSLKATSHDVVLLSCGGKVRLAPPAGPISTR